MKIIAYGMVPIDEEVDDDFYLVHEQIVNKYFKKYVHFVYRVEHSGRVYEDILFIVDEGRGFFDERHFIFDITTGGFYSVNGWLATERHNTTEALAMQTQPNNDRRERYAKKRASPG